MLDRLTVEDFSGRLGEVFRIDAAGHAEALTLTEAAAGRVEPPEGWRRPFSLVFRGESRTAWLAQGIWPLAHPELPGLALFLTCLGPEADGRFRYEAAFN